LPAAAAAVNNIISYAGTVNEAAGLRRAMESRAVIEQAKGILMGRDRCTAETPSTCSRASSHRNVRDIAQAVVDSAHK
jgi:AmiR/NasT family two-component response regulator